jgi:hypothetical protein
MDFYDIVFLFGFSGVINLFSFSFLDTSYLSCTIRCLFHHVLYSV